MKNIYTILLFLMFNFQFSISQAQSVRVFSKTGILKGSYTTVAAALATTTDGDSMLLSAHTFKESKLRGNYSVVYQGTIVGGDTTTIDAMGNGSVFTNCKGTIRDVVLTGAKFVHPSGLGNQGAALFQFEGRITGRTTIRNNEGFPAGGLKGIGDILIDEDVKIISNTVISSAYGFGGTIMSGSSSLTIKDNVLISGNKGDSATIVFYGVDGAASKTKKLSISGNVRFENNTGFRSGFAYLASGCVVELDGFTVINNKYSSTNGANIYVRIPQSSIVFDSIGTMEISMKNVRMYNPTSTGTRQKEVSIIDTVKPVKFHNEGCWWGNSDTTGLIVIGAGTDFTMPNWAVAKWYGVPFGTSGSQVRAQMQLNTGAPLPPNCFKGLEGKFSATAGSFPAPTTVINAGNLIASDYYYPASGPFSITASVDADTFRANNKGALGIKEPGYTTVKVFPNPTTDEVHISNLPAGITLHIFDASGRIVMQRGYLEAQPELVIPVADWPAGVYTINLYNQQDQLGTVKFVKK